MVYNNLYPPIIDAIMPAFVIVQNKGGVPGTEPYRLYFSLSKYNSPEMIQHAWLSLTDSRTNESMLKKTTGVARLRVYEDTTKKGDNRFYVKIWATGDSAILKNAWEIDKIYKAQIRFSSVGEDPSNPEEEISNNMAAIIKGQNENRFSEWSTVSLLQPILRPTVTLRGFSSQEVIMSSLGNVVSGAVEFEDGGELESYQIQIYTTENSKLEYDSGVIFSDVFASNEIYHEIRYGFVEGVRYTMKLTYTTKSAYIETKEYKFIVLSATGEPLDVDFDVTPNSVMGRMEIKISSLTERFLGNLTIRRASSKENFTIWEDVQHIAITQEELIDVFWCDYGVESGVWYKYCVQKRNARGDRGLAVMCKEPVMVLLEDIFLSDADKCLRIKFNPQISSYTHVLSETSTQTIGAKYPFIKRNANTHYRQFSISGLISHFMDEGDLFTNKEELYKDNLSLYQQYNDENRITDYNDFILEQKFREKIEEFLYDGQVKLFRSSPEGTMLIRLMNISLNPEVTLGRMLYSFSATAYEIADFTVDNLKKYNLQKLGSLEKVIIGNYEKTGYIEINAETELLAELQKEEDGYKGAKSYQRTVKHLDKIEVKIDDAPRYYDISKINIPSDDEDKPLKNIVSINSSSGATNLKEEDIFYGYVISINNQPFLISPQIDYPLYNSGDLNPIQYGYYKLEGKDLEITQLSVKSGTIKVQYNLIGEEEENIEWIPKEIYLYNKPGQITGYFDSTDELSSYIMARHNKTKGQEYEKLYSIEEISVEAEPGTVFYVQDSSDLKYKRFVLGETGFLNIKDKDFSIRDICFLGKHLKEKTVNENGSYLDRETFDDEFKIIASGDAKETVSEIEKPEKNGVYRVQSLEGVALPSDIYNPMGSNSYLIELSKWATIEEEDGFPTPYYMVIYYRDCWRLFTYSHGGKQDIVMPTYVHMDYRCEIEKGEYS